MFLSLASPVRLFLAACLLCAPGLAVAAETPLHERIDQAIAARVPDFARVAAPPAADAEFLRRIYLDLTGAPPTSTQARAFLRDATANKRQLLIDRLLASSEHARHLATVFDVMLMERLPDKQVPRGPWLDYLRQSFAGNKPWDQMVREILSSDGADPKTRHLAKFILERGAEPNVVTRDISRLFLGMNLQCCQCHDHPLIADYHQEHYYGLFAFVSRTSLVVDKKLKRGVLSEKADGEVTFQSVFDPAKVTKHTGPRMPGARALVEKAPAKGQEYLVKPAAGQRSVPRLSRRSLLGPNLARADNVAFKRNIANRLWALMMGQGLVEPLDRDHPGNPSTHPELLTLLADDMAAHHFDMRRFLRELALSQTYQRSSEPRPGVKEIEPNRYVVASLKPLAPEALAWSLMQATGLIDAERRALGTKATEAALYARLAGNVTPFVRTFGAAPGTPQTFDARVDQALFLANGTTVRGWLSVRPGNLVDRLNRLANADAVAEELYLSVLTRLPDSGERREVADFLKERPAERTAALQDLAWALLTSAEFRFNH